MRITLYWQTWLKDYRWIWNILLFMFAAGVIFFWTQRVQGPDAVIDWIKLQEQKAIETTVHGFQLGPFHINVPADSYVILEYLHGSDITPNVTASYLFLFAMACSLTILVAVITTMEKYWYFAAMGLFILVMVSLRFEVLGLFGLYSKPVAWSIIAAYAALSFYFNKFGTAISFIKRLGLFSTIGVVLGVIIQLFAHVEYPFYHLTLTAYTAGLIISVLFIIMVAHEIIAALITVVSQGSTHTLRHFLIIAMIYMGNVIVTCFHELGYIQWNFVYIDLYLLLTCSAVLGVWGFRQREIQYGYILPFAPYGGFVFLSLGIICFFTTGQLLGNWNDPALKVIRDAIIFSHTGYGVIFLIYIFSNFIYLLARNLPVQKVLYNPTRMPYFTYRFAGMIAMLGFVFYSNWREYVFHSVAGFYNTTGDLYQLLNNESYAETFYQQGSLQAFQNNRSNYALGSIHISTLSLDEAQVNYSDANGIRPTAYSLANAGNVYIWEGRVDEAIATYEAGESVMHGSGELENNLGFALTKDHQLDSAIFYLTKAREHNFTRQSAEINFFALAALEKIPMKVDSILGVFGLTSPAARANAIALSTLLQQPMTSSVDPIPEGPMNLFSAMLLNNYIVKHATTLDTAFISRANKVISDSVNADFSEYLKSSLAFGYYHRGNVARALEIMAEVVYVTQNDKGKYNYVMGLWALEQGNPALASSYFTYADTYDYKDARFYNAIALSESGNVSDAIAAWDSVTIHHSGQMQAIAIQMKKILTLPAAAATALSDNEKYQFLRYRVGLKDSLMFDAVLKGIEAPDFKAQAILDISRRYYEADMLIPAIRYFQRIAGLELTNKELYEDIRHFELLMLATQRDLKRLADQINNGITFEGGSIEKNLYTAMIAELSGDLAKASANYQIVATYNPYLEEGILAAADYFRKHDKNKLRAYSILAEAIQINSNSIRLLKAYSQEATRVGFDDFAATANDRIILLERAIR